MPICPVTVNQTGHQPGPCGFHNWDNRWNNPPTEPGVYQVTCPLCKTPVVVTVEEVLRVTKVEVDGE